MEVLLVIPVQACCSLIAQVGWEVMLQNSCRTLLDVNCIMYAMTDRNHQMWEWFKVERQVVSLSLLVSAVSL